MGIAFRCVLSSGGGSGSGTLTVIGSDVLSGIACTCTDGVTTLTETFPSSAPYNVVFQVPNAGQWTVSVTYHGDTHSETVVISLDQTVDLGIFHLEDWLAAGEVEGTYATLDEVFADELAVRKLCLKHNAVDYLANRFVDTNLETIFNNGLFAKWTNNSDYALDKYATVSDLVSLMDEVDKYGYGELMMDALVKSASSTQTEEGVISRSGATLNTDAYNVFADRVYSSDYTSTYSIIYTLTNPKMVYSLGYRISSLSGSTTSHKVKAEYSEDGTSWTEIQEKSYTQSGNYSYVDELLTINKKIKAIRLTATMVSTYNCGLGMLRVNDIMIPKGNVPVMTANNAPYGTANGSNQYSGYEYYKVFDNDSSTSWSTSGASSPHINQYVSYKFTNPICIKRFFILPVGAGNSSSCRVKNYKIEGSNTGNTNDWTTLYTGQYTATNANGDIIDVNNSNFYMYYRCYVVDEYTGSLPIGIVTLQFYGRELSVSVPTMATNTTPYGEASASNTYDIYYPWKAFDGTNGNGWFAYAKDEWVEYDFKKPVKVEMITYGGKGPGSKAVTTYPKFQGYDGTDWDDLTNEIEFTIPTATTVIGKVASMITSGVYQKYRMILSSESSNHDGNGFKVQFYGKDYSEKEFEQGTTKKWLYDHGVELVPISYDGANAATGITHNTGNEIYVNNPTNTAMGGFNVFENLTPYVRARIKFGDTTRAKDYEHGEYALGYKVGSVNYGWSNMDGYISYSSNASPNPDAPNNWSYGIAAVTQAAYLIFSSGAATGGAGYNQCKVKELWLE